MFHDMYLQNDDTDAKTARRRNARDGFRILSSRPKSGNARFRTADADARPIVERIHAAVSVCSYVSASDTREYPSRGHPFAISRGDVSRLALTTYSCEVAR